MPTNVAAGAIGNIASIIMSNNPGITPEDAMTIMYNNYLTKKKFQYKDETTNWELVDGGYWYFIDIWKLLKNELLHADKFNNILFDKESVQLPDGKGICYTGKGVQFEFDNTIYDNVKGNESILNQALMS